MTRMERSGRRQRVSSDTNVDTRDAGPNDNGFKDEGGFAPPPKRQAMASMTCVVLAMFPGCCIQHFAPTGVTCRYNP